MKQLVLLGMLACLGAASPIGLLGNPDAIYGRLQRNSYVPYPNPKPDFTRLYLALKNAHLQEPEQDYEYAPIDTMPIRHVGSIFEAAEDAMQYDDARDDIPNQQPFDIGTVYDEPIDVGNLDQSNDVIQKLMPDYFDRPETKKAEPLSGKIQKSFTASSTESSASTSTTTSTTKPPQLKIKEHKEDKIPKVSKLHGQKEYAMLRPAGVGGARRPLPELWPEDAEVQQLKRASHRSFRKPSSAAGAMDELTSELDSLKPHKKH